MIIPHTVTNPSRLSADKCLSRQFPWWLWSYLIIPGSIDVPMANQHGANDSFISHVHPRKYQRHKTPPCRTPGPGWSTWVIRRCCHWCVSLDFVDFCISLLLFQALSPSHVSFVYRIRANAVGQGRTRGSGYENTHFGDNKVKPV